MKYAQRGKFACMYVCAFIHMVKGVKFNKTRFDICNSKHHKLHFFSRAMSKMDGEVQGSRPTKCMCNLPIKKKNLNMNLFPEQSLLINWVVTPLQQRNKAHAALIKTTTIHKWPEFIACFGEEKGMKWNGLKRIFKEYFIHSLIWEFSTRNGMVRREYSFHSTLS